MSKGDLIKLDENTELMKISNDKYRYVNPTFTKPSAKLSDFNADIKLKVANEYFKAHKDVLSSASDYFSAMFSHDMAEKGKDYIELKGISLGGFQIMLEYFYHGHITLVMESVEHCLEASRFFHVEWLTKVCCNYLMRHLTVDNCLQILNLADTYCLLDLVSDMYSFIGLNAIRLMDEGKVSQLPYEILAQLISGEYYIDLPEEMVLGMIVDWANADFQTREQYLADLLTLIKYHLFSSEELDNIPDALISYKGVQQCVDKAKQLWLNPNKWSVLGDDEDISGRGGREVMVLISEWNSDSLQNIDLNNPYLHQEPLGLLERGSVVDFTSLVTLGDFLYCVGGYDTTLQPISSAHMFDPRLRMWIEVHPMNYSRENFPTVAMNNKLYVLGGSTVSTHESIATAAIQILTVSEDWGANTGEAAQNEEVAVTNRASGADEPTAPPSNICLRACECYDPETDLWSVIPALPYGVYAHSACTLNGTIYISGGVTDNLSDPVPVGYCYCWTPGEDSWTRKASMITRRQSHAMFTYNDKIYAMGGYTAGDLEDLSLGMQNCVGNEVYDPVEDKWTPLADTPSEFGHIHRTVAIIDDVAYLLGGTYSSKYLHEFHLSTNELVQGAFCGNDFVKLVKLRMYYPKFMPNDVSKSSPLPDADDIHNAKTVENADLATGDSGESQPRSAAA